MKKENDSSVRFLYGSLFGRIFLKLIQKLHADRLIVRYLRSAWSRPYMIMYSVQHNIALTPEERQRFRSFRDFFARKRMVTTIDLNPAHLISPCDGWLSIYPITSRNSFSIKGSFYRVGDLLEDLTLAKNYEGGICMVFRLCASDCHHYNYFDDGYQGRNHYIEGQLHSVQPIALETCPVFTLNRRSWCLLATENFGPVVQTEIGALIVGGIVNCEGNCRFYRGKEKGHFELAGSTIVLLFEPGRIQPLPELTARLETEGEIRVTQGMWIASRCEQRSAT